MLEVYNATSPAIQLNDGGDYKGIFRLAGNDLEIRGSSGKLELYNGSADGDSESNPRIVIEADGDVGIGTSSPQSEVHISGSGEVQLYIDAQGGNNPGIRLLEGGTNKWTIANDQSDDKLFFYEFTNSQTRMVIESDGKVGIGTTTPARGLEVISGNGIEFSDSARGTNAVQWGTSGGDYTQFMYDQSGVQQVQLHTDGDSFFAGGDVGIGTNSPGNLLHVSQSGTSGNWVARFQNNYTTANEVDIQMGYANSSGRNSGISVAMDDTNSGEYLLNLSSGGTERMRVRADGDVNFPQGGAKVCVGATITGSCGSSMDVIQVGHTSQWYAETSNAADRNVYIGNNFYHDGSNHRRIYEDEVCGIQFRAGRISFRTHGSAGTDVNLEAGGGTERMRITSGGDVNIGGGSLTMAEDQAKLTISGSGPSGPEGNKQLIVRGNSGAGSQNFDTGIATFDNSLGDGPAVTMKNLGSSHTDRGPFQVYNGSTNILATRNDGLISGDFNDTSDRAFKENINSITSSLKEVNKLRPVTFVWKQDEENGMNRGHGKTNIGFIAQEVSESLPRLVSGTSGSVSGMGLNTIGITSVLTKAVQELTEEIRFLRASITGSTDINQLKALVSGSTFV
jgi:hypothetical protein